MTRPDKPGRQALRRAFLEAMSFIASTVSVVTTGEPAGRAGAKRRAATASPALTG